VLSVISLGPTKKCSNHAAYKRASKISFLGIQARMDIKFPQ